MMVIRPALLALALALALPMSAAAQYGDYAYGFSPRTGDVYVDAQLGDINVYARADSGRFIDDIVISFGAPRVLVQQLYTTRRWAPGDIYYACALAYQLRRPCGELVDLYDRDHGQGWGAIAQRLGIKPGSAAFHALKGRVGKGHGALRGGPSRAGNPGNRPASTGQGGERGNGGARGGDDKGGGKGKGKGRG